MNKFLKPNDGHFIKVKSVIQDMVAASAGIMAARGHRKCTHKNYTKRIYISLYIDSIFAFRPCAFCSLWLQRSV
jgi:hypothetical protein